MLATISATFGTVTDINQSPLASYSFDPWGNRTVQSGSDITAVGFTGHEWQADGSLWLSFFRAYDPAMGRWISADPARLAGGINLYAYGDDDPVNNVDSLGLVSVTIVPPVIHYVPKKDVPGGNCGWTEAKNVFSGDCQCKDNGWVAALSIQFRPEIWVATDTTFPPRGWIEGHERSHVADDLAIIEQARRDGQEVEKIVFPSEATCRAAVQNWMVKWALAAARQGTYRDWYGLRGLLCW